MATDAGASRSAVARYRSAVRALLVVSAALAAIASALALGVTYLGGVRCASFPACLLEQPGWAVQAHAAVGAALGIAILGVFLLALLLHRAYPRGPLLAAPTLVLVVVMGGIGAGLTTGALPDLFLLVQSALVVVLLLLILLSYRIYVPRPGVPEPATPSDRTPSRDPA